MIYNNILEAMGKTPIIKLNNLTNENMANVYVKYEGLNVGGSIKTRVAFNMINDAEKKGIINKNTIIVEPTSGNQGIGLSLVGAVKGYKVIIVMPDSVSVERQKIIKQYGAEVELVHDAGNIGECIEDCIKKAYELKEKLGNVYIPQQFENESNLLAHKNMTAKEILDDVDFQIDGFCSGIGTGGTISGVGEELKKKFKDMIIWAIEPENAAILSNGPIGSHIQMGIGDGLIPKILNTKIYDEVFIVKDEDALNTSKELAKKEGLLVGISSGTNVFAALKLAEKLGKGKNVLTILPDTGERYISTELFD